MHSPVCAAAALPRRTFGCCCCWFGRALTVSTMGKVAERSCARMVASTGRAPPASSTCAVVAGMYVDAE